MTWVVRTFETSIGPLTATGDGRTLHRLQLDSDESVLNAIPRASRSGEAFETLGHQLGEYFDGTRSRFDIPLALNGTPMQLRAWQAVQDIGYGDTITYGELARRIGIAGAARAAGSLNARTPLCVIVPSHHVIGPDGALPC